MAHTTRFSLCGIKNRQMLSYQLEFDSKILNPTQAKIRLEWAIRGKSQKDWGSVFGEKARKIKSS